MNGYRRADDTIVVFHVGDTRFGIAADAVEEICGVEELRAMPPEFRSRSINHCLTRRGHYHAVIDTAYFFRMLPARADRVLILRHDPIALLIGNVDRMQDVSAVHDLPRSFQGDERRWFRGLVRLFDGVVPLVNPQAFFDIAHSVRQPVTGVLTSETNVTGVSI